MLRISPGEVSFNDMDACAVIYGQTSKFEKAEYFYRAFEDLAPNLFTIRDRQQHAQDKRLISHAFSKANIVQHQASIFDKAARLMDRIAERIRDGQTVPLFPAFRCMTLDTIAEFAFGTSTGALELEDFESDIFEAIDAATGSVPFVSLTDRGRTQELTGRSFSISRSSGKPCGGQATTSWPPCPTASWPWARPPTARSGRCTRARPGPCSET